MDPSSRNVSIGGEIVDQRAAPIAYDRGRICAHPECNTVLSVYNEDPYCSLHAGQSGATA